MIDSHGDTPDTLTTCNGIEDVYYMRRIDMAKHPHRLILQQKRTWKCTIPGCSFFVHLGLAHVLIGKMGVCWECGQQYTIDEDALKHEMPKCSRCRSGVESELERATREIERKLALQRHGKIQNSEMSAVDRLRQNLAQNDEDKPESENVHEPECEVHVGGECDCALGLR